MSHATINSAAAAIGIDRATLIEQLHRLETDSARASTTAPPATATSPPATAATFSPHSTALTSSPYARSEPGYHAPPLSRRPPNRALSQRYGTRPITPTRHARPTAAEGNANSPRKRGAKS